MGMTSTAPAVEDVEPQDNGNDQMNSRAVKQWSVFVYVDGDNNLEKFAIEDINEMEVVGSSDDVNIVIQVDRVNGFDKSNGDWTDTRRYYVTKDDNFNNISSELLSDSLGELNMADKNTLYDFLDWGLDNYPAEHYLIVMWDHGRGIFRSGSSGAGILKGFNEDLTSNTQEMKLWELDEIMLDLKVKNGGKSFDILGFDQCWLGNMETAYELMDSVDFLVASADEEPDKGWNYEVPLKTLVDNPYITPEEFAIEITNDYIAEYTNKSVYDYMTQATVDLNFLNSTYIHLLNDFSDMLVKHFYENQDVLFELRQKMENYYYPCPDFFYFVKLVQTNTSLPHELRSTAQTLLDNYSRIILTEGHGNSHPNGNGLAIYFPDSLKYNKYYDWQLEYDEKIDFSQERWVEFLKVFYDPLRIDHKPLKDTEDTVNPYRIEADVKGYRLDKDKVGVFYSDDGSAFSYVNLTQSEDGNTFTAELPAQPENTDIYYYIEARDLDDNSVCSPENAPDLNVSALNHFFIGKDTIQPEIYHGGSADKIYTKHDYEIVASVIDNIGVNRSQVLLYYKLDDDKDYIAKTMTLVPGTENQYRAHIPSQTIGTEVIYYFEATDTVRHPNTARLPTTGDFKFRILGIIINIARDQYHTADDEKYDHFYQLLKAPGYNISYITDKLKMDNLAEMDLLVITEPAKEFTTNERTVLKEYLESGGRLFIIGGTNSTIMNSITQFGNLNITWSDNLEGSDYSGTFGSNPTIFNKVNELRYTSPALTIEPSKTSTVLVENDLQTSVLAIYTYLGQGKVVAITRGFFHEDVIEVSYNIQFLNNLGQWLVRNPIAVPIGPSTKIEGTVLKEVPADGYLNIYEDDDVGFDGNASVNPEWQTNLLNFTWDFGDGYIGYGPQPVHKYTDAGVYNIDLTVKTRDGFTDTAGFHISVENVWPVAYPGYSKIDGRKVYFNASATTDTPSDQHSLTYQWDFGDGTTGTGIAPVHVYPSNDVYYATLTVTDDDNATSVCRITIDLSEPPTVSSYYPAIGAVALVVIVILVYFYMQKKKPGGTESKKEDIDKEDRIDRIERKTPPVRRRTIRVKQNK